MMHSGLLSDDDRICGRIVDVLTVLKTDVVPCIYYDDDDGTKPDDMMKKVNNAIDNCINGKLNKVIVMKDDCDE